MEVMEESRFFGDYRLIKQIGQGSVGTVFVAEHRFTKKKNVLKVLPEELSTDRAFMQRFEEEIATLASFDHPHVVKIHNVSFSQGVYFLVCECIVDAIGETTNLSQYFSAHGKKLTQEEILSILEQVASALDYGHAISDGAGKKLVHRGLKLNNILVEGKAPQIHVRISDWGLSKVIGLGSALTRTFKGMAESLGFQGTVITAKIGQDRYPQPAFETNKLQLLHQSLLQNFAFLAPEQKRLDPSCDERVDSFAFGVLAHYLLTGGEYPEGSFSVDFCRNETPLIDWSKLVVECLRPNKNERPAAIKNFIDSLRNPVRTPVAKPQPPSFAQTFSFHAQESVVDTQIIVEPMALQQKSPSPLVKEERIVKEYAPEKRDFQHIQPIFTEMVAIEGGYYFRGSDTGCRDEMPRHRVTVESFSIDIHPVTNEQFVRFLELIGGEKDSHNQDILRLRDSRIKKSGGKFSIEPGYSKHPVVGVTWYGAVAYCNWIGKRLPREAEWEIACCGGLENPLYPTGETIEKTQANFFSADTTAVMSYPPNGLGLYDMVGNVYEWCHDWYEYSYYDVSALEPDNPKGPLQGVYRVLRGGCWKSLKEDLRTSKRHRNNPGAANGTYGFRCAK
jgi:formylglycine-generating enzyme required for sulfatase activity